MYIIIRYIFDEHSHALRWRVEEAKWEGNLAENILISVLRVICRYFRHIQVPLFWEKLVIKMYQKEPFYIFSFVIKWAWFCLIWQNFIAFHLVNVKVLAGKHLSISLSEFFNCGKARSDSHCEINIPNY